MNKDLALVRQQQFARGVKLGKKPARYDMRTLKLSKYLTATLAPPPSQAGYVTKVPSWSMSLNDVIGDCTIAAAAHMITQWTTYAGAPYFPTDAQVLDAYEAVSGYNPNNPNSDNGAVMLDVLNYWRTKGIAGHKIAAFVAVDQTNHEEVKQAIQLFGNVYIGIGLPVWVQSPLDGLNGDPVWSTAPTGTFGDGAVGSWGGHCVPIVGYGADSAGNTGTEVITWGQIYDMTWGFIDAYCDEMYAVLSQDWFDAAGESASGFDKAQLQADLAALQG